MESEVSTVWGLLGRSPHLTLLAPRLPLASSQDIANAVVPTLLAIFLFLSGFLIRRASAAS